MSENNQKKNLNSESEKCPLPAVTFSTFVLSLASSALVALGEVADPQNEQISEDLLAAKHTIDVLGMLREKTEKNLDSEEEQLIDGVLYELRMKYIIKSK